MTNILKAYIESIAENNSHATTIRKKAQVNKFLQFCKMANIKDLNDIESTDIENFMIYRKEQGNLEYGNETYKAEVFNFFNWCVEESQAMLWNPLSESPPSNKCEIPFRLCPPKSMVNSLVEFIDNPVNKVSLRAKCLVRLSLTAGLRTFEHSDLKYNALQDGVLKVIGKYNRPRFIPLDKPTIALVEEYISTVRYDIVKRFSRKSDALFLGRRCTRFTPKSISRIFTEELKTSLSPYHLRHYFAQTMYENGCDLGTLSELMGHSNPNSLASYVKVNNVSRKRKILKKYKPFAGI